MIESGWVLLQFFFFYCGRSVIDQKMIGLEIQFRSTCTIAKYDVYRCILGWDGHYPVIKVTLMGGNLFELRIMIIMGRYFSSNEAQVILKLAMNLFCLNSKLYFQGIDDFSIKE